MIDGCQNDYAVKATSIEYAVTSCETDSCVSDSAFSLAPRTLSDEGEASYRDLRLEEVLQLGLAHASVLRDVGGAVVVHRRQAERSTTRRFVKRTRRSVSKPL